MSKNTWNLEGKQSVYLLYMVFAWTISENGDVDLVQDYLQNGADVNYTADDVSSIYSI
jgi:hypothetical protein